MIIPVGKTPCRARVTPHFAGKKKKDRPIGKRDKCYIDGYVGLRENGTYRTLAVVVRPSDGRIETFRLQHIKALPLGD